MTDPSFDRDFTFNILGHKRALNRIVENVGLIDSLVEIAASLTMVEMKRAQRVLLEKLIDSKSNTTSAPRSFHRRIVDWLGRIGFRREKAVPRKMDLHALRGSVKLMMDRDSGRLSAWEGIRLVREIVQEQEGGVNAPGMDETPESRAA